jgi:hypothetical protein
MVVKAKGNVHRLRQKVCRKEELFLMFCVSQRMYVNAAAFLLSNFTKIIEDPTLRISIGGFVTLLAKALDLHTPVSDCLSAFALTIPYDRKLRTRRITVSDCLSAFALTIPYDRKLRTRRITGRRNRP